ncbi:MAG: hypothetical protein GY819_19975 [Planctomycetaceae bacterium]|nr:hypothetical protein [Planctomycetaceae bacterium]
MLYPRSFNRFILISLALLGLSVSSAIAGLYEGNDSIFGIGSITIDTTNDLAWLDLTISRDKEYSYDDMRKKMATGGDFEGWRYATEQEVRDFWTSGGGPGGAYDGVYDDAKGWAREILKLWGATLDTPRGGLEAHALTGTPYLGNGSGGTRAHKYATLSELPGFNGNAWICPTSAGCGMSDDDYGRFLGHALVRTHVLPVPAAIWLFGTALIGFVGISRRRKLA